MQRIGLIAAAVVLLGGAGAGAGWAVQSERGTPARQATERPIFLACTGDQQSKWNFCLTERRAACIVLSDGRQRQACVDGINSSCSSALGIQC